MSNILGMPKAGKFTREDLKWATSTEHHLAKANDQSGYLFCVELKTENQAEAVRRATMVIELLASWGHMLRNAGGLRKGVYKSPSGIISK